MLNNPMCLEHSDIDRDYDLDDIEKNAREAFAYREAHPDRRTQALISLKRLADDLESAPQRVAIPDGTGIMCQVVGPDNYISEQIRLALRDLAE